MLHKRFSAFTLLISATAGLPAMAAAQDAGQKTYAMCQACHKVERAAPNGVGPNLNGLFGRTAGSVPRFNYSAALKASKIRWDEKTLDAFLASPTKLVPGTRMVIGVSDPKQRAALILYLKRVTAK